MVMSFWILFSLGIGPGVVLTNLWWSSFEKSSVLLSCSSNMVILPGLYIDMSKSF